MQDTCCVDNMEYVLQCHLQVGGEALPVPFQPAKHPLNGALAAGKGLIVALLLSI